MHLLPPANECRRPLTDDPDFWLRDLRLGRYAELARYLADDEYRAARSNSLPPTQEPSRRWERLGPVRKV